LTHIPSDWSQQRSREKEENEDNYKSMRMEGNSERTRKGRVIANGMKGDQSIQQTIRRAKNFCMHTNCFA